MRRDWSAEELSEFWTRGPAEQALVATCLTPARLAWLRSSPTGVSTAASLMARALNFPYVDGPLLARYFAAALTRLLAPICPACLRART